MTTVAEDGVDGTTMTLRTRDINLAVAIDADLPPGRNPPPGVNPPCGVNFDDGGPDFDFTPYPGVIPEPRRRIQICNDKLVEYFANIERKGPAMKREVIIDVKSKVIDIRNEYKLTMEDWEKKYQKSEETKAELTATVTLLKADIKKYKESSEQMEIEIGEKEGLIGSWKGKYEALSLKYEKKEKEIENLTAELRTAEINYKKQSTKISTETEKYKKLVITHEQELNAIENAFWMKITDTYGYTEDDYKKTLLVTLTEIRKTIMERLAKIELDYSASYEKKIACWKGVISEKTSAYDAVVKKLTEYQKQVTELRAHVRQREQQFMLKYEEFYEKLKESLSLDASYREFWALDSEVKIYEQILDESFWKRRIFMDGEDTFFTQKPNPGRSGIEICNMAFDGKYIKLTNRSTKTVELGGWTLKVTLAEKKVTFKFPEKFKIDPNQTVKVWSSDQEVEAGDLALEKGKLWQQVDKLKVELANVDGKTESSRMFFEEKKVPFQYKPAIMGQ